MEGWHEGIQVSLIDLVHWEVLIKKIHSPFGQLHDSPYVSYLKLAKYLMVVIVLVQKMEGDADIDKGKKTE